MSEEVRVVVDRRRCVGTGTCAAIAPAIFVVEDGVAVPSADPLLPSEDLLDAVASCPVEAIRLVSDD